MKFFVALEILTIAIVANGGVSMNNPFLCYITDPIRSITYRQAAYTSYESMRRFNFTTVSPYIAPGYCKQSPTRFWYLGRDGGRFPNPSFLLRMLDFAESSIQEDIVTNYELGRTSLCIQDFEAIRNWTKAENFVIGNGAFATAAAEIAMQNIAFRYQQRYPNILSQTYDPENFYFRHAGSERASTSIRAFAYGLFRGDADVVYEDVPIDDWFMRSIDFCPAYIDETLNGRAWSDAFSQGPEMLEMLEQINKKLGFQGSNQLDFTTVQTMWRWCTYETASKFELSSSEIGDDAPWCAPFSVAHNLLMEYYEDLIHFYFTGYGVRNQRLIENLNCGLMQDLLIYMRSEDDTEQMARIFVTHSEEVQVMLVAFGAFRDIFPLNQQNYAEQTSRRWLTSLIAPHAANLVIVRHDCLDGDHDLVFLLNEKPIALPGCDQQTGVCKLNATIEQFQRFIDVNCVDYFCTDD